MALYVLPGTFIKLKCSHIVGKLSRLIYILKMCGGPILQYGSLANCATYMDGISSFYHSEYSSEFGLEGCVPHSAHFRNVLRHIWAERTSGA